MKTRAKLPRAAPEKLEHRLRDWIDRYDGQSPECLARALGHMLTEGELARLWLKERLADMAKDKPLLPAGFADPVCQSLVILDHARVHLSLAMISAAGWNAEGDGGARAQHTVEFADGWTTIRFLSAPHARIQRHLLSQTGAGWLAFREAPEPLTTGQAICLNNATEAVRFVEVGADVIMLRMLVRDPDSDQVFECDALTGAVLRVREAQSHHGRIRMALSLLRALGRSDAIAAITRAMASWPAHLRWHAVREALATDAVAGFALLQTLARTDPDSQVRALATQTRDDLVARYPQLAA
ncbi:MAG: hypothetical protein MEP44_02195 [Blastomonas sp.]|nr:hypothetical protein [Blastomonas sp.]